MSGVRPSPPYAWLVCAAAALVHLGALRNGFTVDDAYIVVDHPAIRSLAAIPTFFTGAWGVAQEDPYLTAMNAGYYRPLTMVLHALQLRVFGLSAVGFHAVSVALHVGNTAAVWGLLGRLRPGRDAAASNAVGALLFAVHPVHVEPINPATYQSTLLAGLLVLGAAYVWLGPLGPTRLLRAAALSTAAMFAKEDGVIFPLWMIAVDVLLRRRPEDSLRGRAGLVFGACLALYLAARSHATDGFGFSFFGDAPIAARIATMATVATLDLRLLAVGVPTTPFYDWYLVPIVDSLGDPRACLGYAVVAAWLAAGVWLHRRGAKVAALGLAFVPLALAHVSQIVPILIVASDRFLYLPSVGLAMLAAELAARGRRARVPLLVVCGLYAALTVRRTWDWRDDTSLARATARDFPQTPTPHLDLAAAARAAGDVDAELRHLIEARRRDPSLGRTYTEAIRAEVRRGRLEAARAHAEAGRRAGVPPERLERALGGGP